MSEAARAQNPVGSSSLSIDGAKVSQTLRQRVALDLATGRL